jgi:malate/lactate dehydrogenase
MKVGVVGVGRVGAACALSLVVRGSAREVVLADRTRAADSAGTLTDPIFEHAEGTLRELTDVPICGSLEGGNIEHLRRGNRKSHPRAIAVR